MRFKRLSAKIQTKCWDNSGNQRFLGALGRDFEWCRPSGKVFRVSVYVSWQLGLEEAEGGGGDALIPSVVLSPNVGLHSIPRINPRHFTWKSSGSIRQSEEVENLRTIDMGLMPSRGAELPPPRRPREHLLPELHAIAETSG